LDANQTLKRRTKYFLTSASKDGELQLTLSEEHLIGYPAREVEAQDSFIDEK